MFSNFSFAYQSSTYLLWRNKDLTIVQFFFSLLNIELYNLFIYFVCGPLIVMSFANIYSHSVDCLFILSMFLLAVEKLLSLIRSHFILLFPLRQETDGNNIAMIYVRVFSLHFFLGVSQFSVFHLGLEFILSSFINSNSILVVLYSFQHTVSCQLQVVTVLLLPTNLEDFYFFSLNDYCGQNIHDFRSGESGHPCLVPDFRGKAFSLLPLNMILIVFVISDFYYVQIYSLHIKYDESFCNE